MDDREIKIIIVFLSILLVYFYGAMSATLNLFPFQYLKAPVYGAAALVDALNIEEYGQKIRWVQPAPPETGTVVDNESRYAAENIVYTTTHDTIARLMNREGEILHRWTLNFNEDWPDKSHIISMFPLDDSYFYLRDIHLYANGDILALVSAGGTTPWGMGLVRMDKNSNVIWTYSGYINNDFHVMPDGTIYAIEHVIKPDMPDLVPSSDVYFLEDNLLHLSAAGEVIGRVSLIEALNQSQFQAVLRQMKDDGTGDITHSNSIEYVDRSHPDVPWLEKGNLLISVRNINVLLVYSPDNNEIINVLDLRTRMQHDIDYLDNGNLLLYDNQGDFAGTGYTRVIEFDPGTQEIVWQYNGQYESQGELHTEFWGEQQALPNGNIFIVHGEQGGIREVTRDGEIAWQYYIPHTTTREGKTYIAVITHAEIVPDSRTGFLQP